MSVKWSWCSNLNRWDLLYRKLCMLHDEEKLSIQWPCSSDFRRFARVFLFVVNTLTVFLSFCYIYKYFVRQLPSSFCHFCAGEMSPGWRHLITWMDPCVGHLNGILARVGGNLNNNFQKSQMPGGLPGGGGMLKLRFDWYITLSDCREEITFWVRWRIRMLFKVTWYSSFVRHDLVSKFCLFISWYADGR